MLFMETRSVFGRESRLYHFKGAQFVEALGYYWLLCQVDRTILAPQNADKQVAVVLITIPALTLANSALFTCLLTHGMLLALIVITQWPRIAQQADERHRPQANHGPSESAWLTVR